MAPDVKTFAALQTYSATTPIENNSEYISRDDESELARTNALISHPVEILTDEEVREYAMNDFGINFDSNDFTVPRINRS